ncbi:Found in Mitochondrial Proteome [Micractinium conductrix]|uniref:Found in Mitochondrial Proteome n=1 Tax=Micractinium conductrix TaxID=554055 RepID=A0A2P6V883_9CHLO|nr:Found in Mitochondrial Proteome [Micractinium conductrix]|eukprot:PSC70288.1 Found in Mitochondrial Proteome [Micractinium conductrix]
MPPKRLSGLQRQVLSLYRNVLRTSRDKVQAGGDSIAAFGRQEFERYRGLDKKDILRIEHLLRRGRRQLELFQTAEVTGMRLGAPSSSSSSRSGLGSSSGVGSSSSAGSSGSGGGPAGGAAQGGA